ncbi:hypothetical protein A3D05_05995 [Candidatus Gottesmanbacteria bacterium RIFCSPHIGHO2_02_FULL_40_24]|uniref:GIY-YIG domain-containing protein n=1 Tax=Candidatus Gottesmanbacteria bacterium RIFCSPHIGHO2_01_FULL_40_15 TaxID=1798376 RepID=A0A1F5Z8C2_9BACT|nr:MAG: hypothetical protein A2777_02915 [Candidatus Gottesmanbacteria bacterium RIFCSPHIGHO2_01_FULL_40_15]OGG16789.1 MAG: hypothetical protein A3D05_05995 [Candidatus Gottesmanbacteria bacterium RIFCSPHIGHO2_02_FULL_40_24]OGG23110.1 MAG: hypothetical protein A3E42_04090 [Candidatus Gottesmanbacteria bacterium RIFCSPHIGHO2_12_FULL_40_13]
MFFVYILKSIKDGKYYIGQTNNIDFRLIKHNQGEIKSTRNRRPLKLIYFEKFISRAEAMHREQKLKSYKNHQYVNRIIRDKGPVV